MGSMDYRIACVDDEEALLATYNRILLPESDESTSKIRQLFSEEPKKPERLKFQDVQTYLEGEEAYLAVKTAVDKAQPFSVVFIDVRMPGWDGIKTARKIRKIDPDIQIVLVTAFADYTLDEIQKEIGYPEKLLIIKKPFDPDEIYQTALVLSCKWFHENTSPKVLRLLETVSASLKGDMKKKVDEIREYLRKCP